MQVLKLDSWTFQYKIYGLLLASLYESTEIYRIVVTLMWALASKFYVKVVFVMGEALSGELP